MQDRISKVRPSLFDVIALIFEEPRREELRGSWEGGEMGAKLTTTNKPLRLMLEHRAEVFTISGGERTVQLESESERALHEQCGD